MRGEIQAVISPDLRAECEHIYPRAVKRRDFDELISQFLDVAELVNPTSTPRAVPDDPDDDKVIAAATAGQVAMIVTNDRHLLVLDPYDRIRIVRPSEFIRRLRDQDNG
jgi:predicted nucleic acid-binding protein